MEKYRRESREHPIEKVGADLRGMMPWIEANKLVDKTKNQFFSFLLQRDF